VVRIQVRGLSDNGFIDVRAPERARGNVLRAERRIMMENERIGDVTIEMDDLRSQRELRDKQRNYALVLAVQVTVSLLLILAFLRKRLHAPLRTLAGFSDRLSRGDFDTPLVLDVPGELGRLGTQMEAMRVAIRDLFVDVARREEQFRSIVSQVPGAVFRARARGAIDFVSDAIEGIAGVPAAYLMRGDTDAWSALIHPDDRALRRQVTRGALTSGRA
jgi:PAS domain-containing protein